MKVRWMRNSLRLRITPGEFEGLLRGEAVVETAAFPGGWSVTLGVGDDSALRSDSPGNVWLTLSSSSLAELSQLEVEGVYFAMDRFKFFVEKDFPCVHPRPKEVLESTETFAPPAGFAERHKTVCL